MKRIILIRHGKAEDGSYYLPDFERSLTVKGKIVAHEMAGRLREKEKSIGQIVSSPAFRALETAMIFAGEFGYKPHDIIIRPELYLEITLKRLPLILAEIDERTETITMFGHNPSFSELADILSRDGFDLMPKTGIVAIKFSIHTWSEISANKGTIEYFLKP
jgi:phosphohistidine phosphatase